MESQTALLEERRLETGTAEGALILKKKANIQAKTSSTTKQQYRENLRRYYTSSYCMGLEYIIRIILMLMNFKEINTLKADLGEKEYKMTMEAIKKYSPYYMYANLINENIMRMKEKENISMIQAKINVQNKEIMKIASLLPAIDFRIMRAFHILVNNCDLRNVTVPKDERQFRQQSPTRKYEDRQSQM